MSKTYTLKDLWIKACQHDDIDPASKFVVFSTDNPWSKKYNRLACLISQVPVLPSKYSGQPPSARSLSKENKVERRGTYQGVPQYGITGQAEITPSRATAEKWARLENVARRTQ